MIISYNLSRLDNDDKIPGLKSRKPPDIDLQKCQNMNQIMKTIYKDFKEIIFLKGSFNE
jgi:hypothetical protein